MLIVLAGCRQDMHDQPRYEPLQGSPLFADGNASRPLVPGTVPRGGLKADRELFSGRRGLARPAAAGAQAAPLTPVAAKPAAGAQETIAFDPDYVTEFPFPITREVLLRGRERFEIFCTPCHDYLGEGNGMIVQRGLSRPPSFHIPRLQQAPVGYFFDVITNGFGAMYSYASRVPVNDRWAIISYVRVLQFSRNAPREVLPEDIRQKLPATPPPADAGGGTIPPQVPAPAGRPQGAKQ
jgi:hypothetical protein